MEKLIEALELIKAECEEHEDCEECSLYYKAERNCGVSRRDPCKWELTEVDPIPRLFKQ